MEPQPVTPHVYRVRAAGRKDPRDVLAVLDGHAFAVIDPNGLAHLQPVDDDLYCEVLTGTLLSFFDNVDDELGTLFRRAAVSVGTPVPEWGEEIVQQSGCWPH